MGRHGSLKLRQFVSSRGFVWAEKYDLRDYNHDEKIRQAADNENRRLREHERDKASQHVRDFVFWVKQRDPRVPQEEQQQKHAVNIVEDCSEDPEGKAAIDAFYVLSMWLEGLGIKVKEAQKYAGILCEEGCDSFRAIAKLTPEECKQFGIKKNHVFMILSQAQDAAGADGAEMEAASGECDVAREAALAEEDQDDDDFFSRGKKEKKDKKEKKSTRMAKNAKGFRGVKCSYG